MDNNFRITTDYIFELFDEISEQFYEIWVSGQDGFAQLRFAENPDTTGVALDIDPRNFPLGNDNSNYRVKYGMLQILNVDTNKFHTIFINGIGNSIEISISQIGEE